MNKFHKAILAAGSIGIVATVPIAYAMPFSITGGLFTPNSGYGVDSGNNGENGGRLLDVEFSTTGFAAQNFSLSSVGEFHRFDLGTLSFLESDQGNGGNAGIRSDETYDLGLTASLDFGDFIGTRVVVTGAGEALTGSVADPAVDYILSWNPLTVDFGDGGQIRIALETLSFSGNGSKTQKATVSLLRLPEAVSANAVPEPMTLSLLALGIASIAVTRRKPTKNKNA
jgi:hypothetical protein